MSASGVLAASPKAGLATPVWLEGCLAWLHPSGQDEGQHASGDVAILICPPVSWDALHSHHSLRVLATAFAAAGYPTLRFNYPGTGDSADLHDPDQEPWTAWQRSLHAAVDWLRAATGAERVILAGLRLGATLATLVAESRDDVAGLLLLAPVFRGHSYTRQLAIEAQIQHGAGSNAAPPPAGLSFMELRFSAETVARLAAVDLRRVKLRAGLAAAVFLQAPSRPAEETIAAWRQCGVSVTQAWFDGLEPLLRQAVEDDPPPFDPAALLGWLRAAVPVRHRGGALALSGPDRVQLGACCETVLRFGPGGRLVGLLCQPAADAAAAAGRRAVLILNTGRSPHYGLARFGVELARFLAAAGFASLRFDFAGLGDSDGPEGREDVLGPLFDAARSADITAAADALERHGYSRFAVQGLCSGAYHAFHGALADARIDALLLVNLPIFRWHAQRLSDLPKHCLAQLGTAAFWRRLLAGKVALHRTAAALTGRLWDKLQERLALPAVPMLRSFPCRALSLLSRRGAQTLFLFAAGDEGLAAMQQAFGRIKRGAARFAGVQVQVVPGLDHVLTGPAMRQIVAATLLGFLTQVEADAPQPAKAPVPAASFWRKVAPRRHWPVLGH